jgi:hypothetical protein
MKLVLTAIGASLILAGCAAGPKAEDHAAHHPPGAANAAPGMPASPSPTQMDSMMKSMQAMHARLMAAKTPEERAALMQDHMKLMHEGMAMVGPMHGGKAGMGSRMPMSPEMMGKRMEMMEMMMQMMMDREGMRPPAAK